MADHDDNDQDHNDNDQDDGDGYVRLKRDDLKALQARAKQNPDSTQLARENAMLRAGVDFDSKIGAMFARSYDGDLDAAKIRAEAEEIGALRTVSGTQTETEGPQTGPEDRQQTKERQQLAQGSPADVKPEANPYDMARARHKEIIDQGGKEETALAAAFDSMFAAAASGDRRVVWDPNKGFDG